ncbi:MAG: L,D-transpeptidase family protein [Chloroflexota bacterium]
MQPQPHPMIPPRTRRRASSNGKRNWTPWLIVGGTATLGIVLFIAMLGFLGVLYMSANQMPSGVSVAGIPLGTSASAAKTALAALSQRKISLTDADRNWPVSLADLGVTVNVDATLKAAQTAPTGAALQPVYTVNLSQTQNGLVSISALVNIPPTTGNPPQKGRAMDIPVTLDRLRIDAAGELADGVLNLDMIDVDPPAPDPAAPYTGATSTYTVQAGQELGLIAKDFNVDVADIVKLNNISNPDLLYVGQALTIPAAGEYEPTQADAPVPPTNTGKSIVVSTEMQRIYAYEDGKLVRSHLASTGLPNTPTVKGDYSIYVKYLADDMSGPGYFLPQVPYTMYFYQGYGIHGTYWHNSFGRPMSHGCVNLPTPEAEWFYNWASVGTPVRVI